MPDTPAPSPFARRAYSLLTSDDEGRICKDIPDSACAEQPGNFLRHVMSLGASKTADGLADPKLVIAWLFGALGAPAWLLGLVVPIREAGSLLPQLAIAAAIRARPIRKTIWSGGAAVQGIALLGMAATALLLDGDAAGIAIVGLVSVAALARGVCSVSHKDVLGKTLSKSTRGSATGAAGSAAAVLVMLFGAALAGGLLPRDKVVVAGALATAGTLMLLAAQLFSRLQEAPGATEGGGNALERARQQWSMLRDDAQLRRFILTRALLVATALAPPYLLAAASAGDTVAGTLGAFVIASALASIVSAYVWGRLSDRSSRRVLILSALLAATTLACAGLLGWLRPALLSQPPLAATLLFVLMVAHQGVRLGRSTHLVDMADGGRRASYTALSNTLIGIALLGGAAFGLLAHWWGYAALLLSFAAMCAAAAWTGRGLEEVQQR